MVLFIIAGLAEIGGGYLVWLWLREGKPVYWGVIGGIALALSSSGVKPLSSEMGIQAIFFSFYFQFLFHRSIIRI
jgi:drug/metabolite transporter superfamily protein YnfA